MKCSGLLRDMNHRMPEGSNLFCHRRNHSKVTGGAGLADGVWRVGVRRWVASDAGKLEVGFTGSFSAIKA